MLGDSKAIYEEMISKQQEEIVFLRGMIRELQDRLMAFAGDTLQKYKLGDLVKAEAPAPTYVSPLGVIESMAAESEEEKKQKEMAMEQLGQILGAGNA